MNITSGSRLQPRLKETAADVVFFEEQKWTAPRLLEQWSRICKKGRDVTLSPALQGERSANASSGGRRPAASREAAVCQRSSVWPAIGYSDVAFLNTLGQVLRTIDLPFIVRGQLKLAGEVLEQSGWLHAVRAPISAPSNETPTFLDSTGRGRLIDFFVVSESCTPLSRKWQLTTAAQSYALTGRLYKRWREGSAGCSSKGYLGLPVSQ